jgi:hypothetical protein
VPELAIAPVAGLELAIAPVAAEPEHVLVAVELGRGLAVVERELDPVETELELGQAAAELELGRVAVALRTKSAIGARHRDLVPLLTAEDLVAAAETTREPAATEAAIAWERPAAAAAGIAAVAAAAATEAEAEEDAGGKIDERKIKTKPKHDDFIKNFSDRFRDRHFLLFGPCSARGSAGQTGCGCVIAAGTEGLRHTATGCR